VFLLLTSKFVPVINVPLSAIKTSVVIYTGPSASPYTFVWLATPGVLIFLAAFISGYIQKASFSEMFFVLLQTIRGLRNTIITIIAVIATAKVMGYSGMTSDIASTAVDVTGNFYPFIAPIIGSVGTFITGSGTSSNVLFGNLQTDAAKAIGANAAWLAAANSAGTCVGKMISPQSIAIAVGAISLVGKDSEILKAIIKVYVPYAIILGCIVYFGQLFIS
ncbi:L-lactate permease, partial [Megasphaera stantonii]|uniref:L-lactate permease n=1 Tax=Megasphaera stantonii TaxID=2144175 RepID=UPI001D7D7E16